MIYALGESLLDIVWDGREPFDKGREITKNGIPGGAMLNAAVSLARSGMPVRLISELGEDAVAGFILEFLQKNGVDTALVRQYPGLPTSVAIARLDEEKKPVYHFEKHYPEKRRLMPVQDLTPTDVLLFGSLYSLDNKVRPELLKVLHAARRAGSAIIYDPNIRQRKISPDGEAWNSVMENIKLAHVVKASDEDLMALFGAQSNQVLLNRLMDINPEVLAIMTRGKEGVLAYWKGEMIERPAKKVMVKSTVGAGDGFNAGFIYGWVHEKLNAQNLSELETVQVKVLLEYGVRFSAAVCGSLENYIPESGPA